MNRYEVQLGTLQRKHNFIPEYGKPDVHPKFKYKLMNMRDKFT